MNRWTTPILSLLLTPFIAASGCGVIGGSSDGFPSLHGRALLADIDGNRLDNLDGEITLHVHDDWGISELTAPIANGMFEVEVTDGARLEVHRMILGERWAYDRQAELARRGIVPGRGPALPLSIDDDGRVEVIGRRLPPTRLRITDSQATVLGDVQIGFDISPTGHTGEPIVRPVNYAPPSPSEELVLPDRHLGETPVADYWIRAPGFAWKKVRVDHRSGGQQVIQLIPQAP